MNKKKESFEWINPITAKKLEANIKFIAKTTLPTVHPNDLKEGRSAVRIIKKNELFEAAKSLIGRPIGLNHQTYPIYGAYTLDTQWNELENQVEGLGYVPETFLNKIREGEIKKCSVEFHWRNEEETDKGTEYSGVWFPRIDLLLGEIPGDTGTSVSLFESIKREGIFVGEIKLEAVPTGSAVEQIPTGSAVETGSACEQIDTGSAKEERIKNLESAVNIMKEYIKKTESGVNEQIETAKKEAKDEMITKLEAVIPNNMITSRFNFGSQRFVQEIKKVIREAKSNDKR